MDKENRFETWIILHQLYESSARITAKQDQTTYQKEGKDDTNK